MFRSEIHTKYTALRVYSLQHRMLKLAVRATITALKVNSFLIYIVTTLSDASPKVSF